MGLFLVETNIAFTIQQENTFERAVDALKADTSIDIIEVQVAKDFKRAFFIIEAQENPSIQESFEKEGLAPSLTKEVRIVGQELNDVKKQQEKINYLVEWNLPEDLTMDQYLARKKANSVHYAEVPEVTFSRTYVCEDMSKCLCFYDAPDDDAVKRAREAVKAPIDAITPISDKQK